MSDTVNGKKEQSGVFSVMHFGRLTYDGAELLRREGVCAVILCENGGGAVRSAERELYFSSGDILFRSPRAGNEIFLSPDFSGNAAVFEGALARELFKCYAEGSATLKSAGRAEKQIKAFFAADRNPFELHRLLHGIFTEDSREAGHGASVRDIRDYIDAHTDKKITLEELSKQFFISKTQIFRLFVKEYGVAPMRYMLSRKVETAKRLLTETDLRISEIADRLAFTDSKHFAKTFRNFTGSVPGEYRKRNRK